MLTSLCALCGELSRLINFILAMLWNLSVNLYHNSLDLFPQYPTIVYYVFNEAKGTENDIFISEL
jgi:hypothetical protein